MYVLIPPVHSRSATPAKRPTNHPHLHTSLPPLPPPKQDGQNVPFRGKSGVGDGVHTS